jgi:hypothetical protein
MPVCYGRPVAGLRWLLIFAFCAALDLSGPLLPVPAELIEESEEAAHRSEPRRRERPQSGAQSPSTRASEVAQRSAARLSRLVSAALGPRPSRADTPLKLPPPGSAPDSASDDH